MRRAEIYVYAITTPNILFFALTFNFQYLILGFTQAMLLWGLVKIDEQFKIKEKLVKEENNG